jgi:hypothetical protein
VQFNGYTAGASVSAVLARALHAKLPREMDGRYSRLSWRVSWLYDTQIVEPLRVVWPFPRLGARSLLDAEVGKPVKMVSLVQDTFCSATDIFFSARPRNPESLHWQGHGRRTYLF